MSAQTIKQQRALAAVQAGRNKHRAIRLDEHARIHLMQEDEDRPAEMLGWALVWCSLVLSAITLVFYWIHT